MLQKVSRPRFLIWSARMLSLAILLAGLGKAATGDEPKQEDKKDEPKQEAPKKEKAGKLPAPEIGDLEEIIKNLPQGVDPEQLKRMQKEMQRMMEQARQQFPGGAGFAGNAQFGAFGRGRDAR